MNVTIADGATTPDAAAAGGPDRPSRPRRDPPVATIARAWRRLTLRTPGQPAPRRARGGGAPTLIACSGGADSTALALALRATTDRLALAHIVHDLRPRADAEADRDAVRALAQRLGLPFFEGRVVTRASGGNLEAVARRQRYARLAELAAANGYPFVATAHHADDQLESIVMALIRGAGPAGLRGVADHRALPRGITLIRPMLSITRADAQRLCMLAGEVWRTDATNDDTTRLRAALRHGPLADIVRLRPQAPGRAARAARLMADAATMIRARARAVFGEALSWDRAALAAEPESVVGEGLRLAAERLIADRRRDRLTARRLDPVVAAIRDDSTEPRRFDWPGGLRILVGARRVELIRQ